MLNNSSIDDLFPVNAVTIYNIILSCKTFDFDWLRYICIEKIRNVDDLSIIR